MRTELYTQQLDLLLELLSSLPEATAIGVVSGAITRIQSNDQRQSGLPVWYFREQNFDCECQSCGNWIKAGESAQAIKSLEGKWFRWHVGC
jgi:hypothetical protein